MELEINLEKYPAEFRHEIREMLKSHNVMEKRLESAFVICKDIDLNIRKFNLMKPNSIAYNDFYKHFKIAFPFELEQIYKNLGEKPPETQGTF